MSGLCDKCGAEYFVSCHDCLHVLTMLFHTARKALVILPANDSHEEVREALVSLVRFYEDKVTACSIKAKEPK